MRAYLSTLGQSLLFYSGIKTASISDRHAMVGFAGVNLVANAINAIFGGQKKEDPHQLRYLKQKINDELSPLTNAAALPSIDAKLDHSSGRKPGESQAHYFLQKYSVTISEFILRTTGSLSLIVPITNWGKAAQNLRNGLSLTETFKLVKNKNAVTVAAGLFSLSGKGFILAASEPDPFSPEPMTFWRGLREKVMFRMSSVVEVICSCMLAHNRFNKKKTDANGELILDANGLPQRDPDYFNVAGNASIVTGYIPRWIAPYGTREVNMNELYAHAAKALSALPPEKATPMLEQISGELADHFKAKKLDAAMIKKQIVQRMEKAPATRIHANTALMQNQALSAPSHSL